MIAIVDYQTGNCGSVQNMFRRIGVEATITSSADELARAEKLVLPGVGAFDTGMDNLRRLGLLDTLAEQVLERRKPILGICLGMQLFTRGSEEGTVPGLGWIAADTVRFRIDRDPRGAKLPHMGWNRVAFRGEDGLAADMDESKFYFVHSYHVQCDDPKHVLGETEYVYSFPSAIASENILGTQFHPEKSHKHGMRLLRNFAQRD